MKKIEELVAKIGYNTAKKMAQPSGKGAGSRTRKPAQGSF